MKRGMILNKLQPVFRQYGVSLIELLGAVAIGSVVMTGVVQQANTYIDNTKDAYTAEHARMYAEAARGYIKENFKGAAMRDIPAAGTRVTADSLASYLPAGFSAVSKNPYGQEPVLVVRKESVGASTAIKGFLVYTSGTPIPKGRRQFVAAMAGLGGGYVDEYNKPKGSGWDASTLFSPYATLASATSGSVVVSMNMFDPVDVVDYRYLCRTQDALALQPECNKLEQGVNFNINKNSIYDLSSVSNSVSLTINAPQITIRNPGAGQPPTNVTINGNLTANVLRAMDTKVQGTSCTQLGALAREVLDESDVASGDLAEGKGTGGILSCKKAEGESARLYPYQWLPLFHAQEEITTIIGCDKRNNFCRNTVDTACGLHGGEAKFFGRMCREAVGLTATRSTITGTAANSSTYTTWPDGENDTWVATLSKNVGGQQKSPLFCALGFHGQTTPYYDESASGGRMEPIEGKLSKLISTGGAQPVFCRVFPITETTTTRSGRRVTKTIWQIKAASNNQDIPIACHAVCLYQ